jgi:hypothetical protein
MSKLGSDGALGAPAAASTAMFRGGDAAALATGAPAFAACRGSSWPAQLTPVMAPATANMIVLALPLSGSMGEAPVTHDERGPAAWLA